MPLASPRSAVTGIRAPTAGTAAAPQAAFGPQTLDQALAAGRSALLLGEHAAAEASFVRAEALAPGNAQAQFGLAELALWRGVADADAGALARAAQLLAALGEACPHSPGVGNLARLVAVEQQRLDAAP